jgi:toxin ParE1/3/4
VVGFSQWHRPLVRRKTAVGKLLGIAGLRTWQVGQSPLSWCCLERKDHRDVVRLLGERQDLTAILSDHFGFK